MKLSTIKSKRKALIIAVTALLLVGVTFTACAIYLMTGYDADLDAIEAFLPTDTVMIEDSDGNIVFDTESPVAGFIFYPGGKVDHRSYVPLMHSLSEKGILCVLMEMPFDLAVFDVDAADGIIEEYPGITRWYIGGHSLGGSMAAQYLSENYEDFDGLILLGSYSAVDISQLDIDVLSIYGSEDEVLNRGKYDDNLSNLPRDRKEYIITGGCHAYFGMYGEQNGDGEPTISAEEQIRETVEAVTELICR